MQKIMAVCDHMHVQILNKYCLNLVHKNKPCIALWPKKSLEGNARNFSLPLNDRSRAQWITFEFGGLFE